jgi:predicted CopG family antitoxin
MGTTTISLKDEAYEQLKAEKHETESFSDVVLRLTATADTEERIEELAGAFDPEFAAALDDSADDVRTNLTMKGGGE